MQTPTPKVLVKFHEDILELALKKLDKDKISTALAKDLTKSIQKNLSDGLASYIDVGEWIMEELTNTETKIGANFAAAMDEIAQDMIDSITPKKK